MTKIVELKDLQLGDTVQFPPLKVVSYENSIVRLGESEIKLGVTLRALKDLGATATREVEEYPLTWAEALDAMVTRGKVVAPRMHSIGRYRFDQECGRFHVTYPGFDAYADGFTDSAFEDSWRIVEDAE